MKILDKLGSQLGILTSLVFLPSAAHAAWNNGSFESGSAGAAPLGWTVNTDLNSTGVTLQNPQTFASLNLAAGGAAKTVILSSASGPGSQPDATLTSSASLRWPYFGNQCALVNQLGSSKNANVMSQNSTISATDVDPFDGKVHIRFLIAPVLQDAVHPENQQPYAFVQVVDVTKGSMLYSQIFLPDVANAAWQSITVSGTNYVYTDWKLIDVAPGSGQIAFGDVVQLSVVGAGNTASGFWGEVYVDGVGAVPPGIFAEGAGAVQYPDADGVHEDITYTIAYRNGSVSNTNAVGTFATPPNTTYLSASGTGLTFTNPGVGNAGTVSASIGTLAANASGTFKVTVQAPAGTTSPVVAFNYGIHSDQAAMLLGPDITPIVAVPFAISGTSASGGNFTLGFQNTSGVTFEVLFSPDLSTPVSSWTSIGNATEVSSGNYQFTAAMSGSAGFYSVRVSP